MIGNYTIYREVTWIFLFSLMTVANVCICILKEKDGL